jgi:hypothetical protein
VGISYRGLVPDFVSGVTFVNDVTSKNQIFVVIETFYLFINLIGELYCATQPTLTNIEVIKTGFPDVIGS